MDDKRKSTWGWWCAIACGFLLIAYPLSLGPVLYFTQGIENDEVIFLYSLYTPLEWLGQLVPPFYTGLVWYLELWVPHLHG